jgi:hypothetical protein
LPERAIFAVLERYKLFEHHFDAYVFFATDGIAIGHVIMSMFVGYIVALAARGREMIATMTLDLILGAMIGAAFLILVHSGNDSFLWMLPWNFADMLALVLGGVIVRTRRSAPGTLTSKT